MHFERTGNSAVCLIGKYRSRLGSKSVLSGVY